MTIYIFSNCYLINQKIVDDVLKDFKPNDTIYLMNQCKPILLIRNTIGDKRKTNIKSMNIYYTNGDIKGREWAETLNHIILLKRQFITNYEDPDVLFPKNNYSFYEGINEKIDYYFKKDDYVFNKNNLKKKKIIISTGIFLMFYLQQFYPNEKKVLVGFTNEASNKNQICLAHDYTFERRLMLSYTKNRNFDLRYCVRKKEELIDIQPTLKDYDHYQDILFF